MNKSLSYKFVLAFLFLFSIIHAQSPVTDSAILAGNKLWIAGDYDGAFSLFQKSRQKAIEENDNELLAYALTFSGKYLARMGATQQALLTLDSVIALQDSLHPAVIMARREQSSIVVRQGSFEKGIADMEYLASQLPAIPPSQDSLRALVYNSLGNFYIAIDELDTGMVYCTKALEIRRRILPPNHPYLAFGENAIGTVLTWQGSYKEAEGHLQKALDIFEVNFGPNHPQALKIKTNIAVIYTDIGQSANAISIYEECMQYIDDMQPQGSIITLLNMGSAYMTLSDYQEALNMFNLAEARVKQYPDLLAEADSYIAGERSLIYSSLGNQELALFHLDKSIAELTRLYGAEDRQLASSFLRKGVILGRMDRFAEAEPAFERAVYLSNLNASPKDLIRGHVYEFYGDILVRQGKREEAREQLNKALDVYSTTEVPWNIADVYASISDSWATEGNYAKATEAIKKGWQAIDPNYEFSLNPTESVSQYWNKKPIENILNAMSGLNMALYDKNRDTLDLRNALRCTELAIGVLDSQAHYYEVSAYRETSSELLVEYYEDAISFCNLLYSQTGNEAYIKRAFDLAEKNKVTNLRDHLRDIQALNFASVPTELIQREQQYRQQLTELFDPKAEDNLLLEQRDLTLEYRDFLIQLERDYPEYFRLKYSGYSPSVANIQQRLAPDEAMYSYFSGKKAWHIFYVTKKQLAMFEIPHKETSETIADYASFIATPPQLDSIDIKELGRRVLKATKQLLPKLSEQPENLIIIGEDILSQFPFETLLTGEISNRDYKSWPFLGKKSTIHYAYSAELWYNKQSITQRKKTGQYIGFAPQFKGDQVIARVMPGNLAFNADEVRRVSNIMGGKTYIGDRAGEVSLKSLQQGPYILHFATHAYANFAQARKACLFFSPEGDSSEDNRLHAHEIYGLDLPSQLTVLSACHTGLGPYLPGEGVMSLARAFQFAGSERVLTTLWHADDKAISDITVRFFEGLHEGQTTAKALRLAKQAYLAESDNIHAHPYFWGSYILLGEPGTIKAESKAFWPFWAGFLLLVGMLGAVLLKRSDR
ncbi:MAG: CHAT domain-containing protein [Bacteroidia bacterium]